MEHLEKLRHLYEIAEKEEIYQIWKRNYEELSEPFKAFAKTQPIEIQRLLYGYTDAGRLLAQSVGNIACEYMDFIEQKESGAD